jgi:pimeloyl-ACP methyl ester carboxylesterase
MVLSLAGCSSAQPTAPRPAVSASPALDGCLTDRAAQVVAVPGTAIRAGFLGSGARVVVLSNQSDQNLCSWLPFAAKLTAAGYRVVVWDYAGGAAGDELSAVVRLVRSRGAARIALMGASRGAKTSLVAGARIKPVVDGVVSLSAELVLNPGIIVADSVAKLPCPLLLVTADQDPYGSAEAAPTFLAAAPNPDKKLVTVPGSGHGTKLLYGASAGTVVPAVLAFLQHISGG